ncbi:MAG: hypothetical protein QM790_00475 [Nibricoccus sp.]
MRYLWTLFLATSCFLRADVLSDLRSTLTSFDGQEPIAAAFSYEFLNRNGEDDKERTEAGKATARVTESPDGISITWTPDQVQAAKAPPSADKNETAPKVNVRRAMDSINVSMLSDHLNAAPRIRQILEKAELKEEKSELCDGQPARLLVLKLNEKLPKYVKEMDCTVKLWLDSNGIPLAAQSRTWAKGRAFVVFSFEHTETEEWRFKSIGHRLLVISHVKESDANGTGTKVHNKAQTTLALSDGSPKP